MELKQIVKGISKCQKCPLANKGRATHKGDLQARTVIIGQGPGKEEAKQGIPFVGPAGKILHKAIADVGLSDDDFFFTNTTRCLPPQDHAPNEEEIEACRRWLDEELELIKPEVVITLGNVATRAVGLEGSISSLAGRLHDGKIFPMIHPAAVLRDAPKWKTRWDDGWKAYKRMRFYKVQRTVYHKDDTEELVLPLPKQQKPKDFVHLHVHTEHSILDGFGPAEYWMKCAARFGYKAIAITDHGSVGALMRAQISSDDAGIKLISGMEAYMVDDYDDKGYWHITLLVMNNEGWENLLKIVYIASQNFYYRPRISMDDLFQHSEGLIVLSGCSRNILRDDDGTMAEIFKSVWGDRFYLEVQSHPGWEPQAEFNKRLAMLSKKCGIPLVATADAHYPRKKHFPYQDVLTTIGQRTTLSNPKRFKIDCPDLYLQSHKMILKGLAENGLTKEQAEDACNATVEIAERCQHRIPTSDEVIPGIPWQDGCSTAEIHLHHLVLEGMKERLPDAPPQYYNRLRRELQLYESKGFAPYMLLVHNVVQWAEKHNIMTQARGSVSASLVAYLLHITDVDPIKHEVMFERFLDENRTDPPDIDLDVQSSGRETIIHYLESVFGERNVAYVGTEIRMKGKSSLRDVGKAYGVPSREWGPLLSLVPQRNPHDERADETLKDIIDMHTEIKQYSRKHKDAWETAVVLEGALRTRGHAAAGVVVSEDDLLGKIPIELDKQGALVTSFPLEECALMGVLKLDLLGVTALDILRYSCTLAGITVQDIPLEDKATLEYLSSTAHLPGVFQFASPGMGKMLHQLAERVELTFEHLAMANAMYRPALLIGGVHHKVMHAMEHPEDVEYIHPVLEKHLTSTYGVPIYQEQVMGILRDMAGFSWGHVNDLRKMMSAVQGVDAIERERKRFIAGAKRKSISEEVASSTFDMLTSFGAYGFNKAHSVAYALLAYRMAYLRTHYPMQFFASAITYEEDKRSALVIGALKAGLSVEAPDVNVSKEHVVIHEDKLWLPFECIMGMGIKTASHIIEIRGDEPFKTLEDFLDRSEGKQLNRSRLLAMAHVGAFRSMGYGNEVIHALGKRGRRVKEKHLRQKLLGTLVIAEKDKYLSVHIDGTPTEDIRKELPHLVAIGEIGVDEVEVVGVVAKIQSRSTQKSTYVSLIVEDDTGKMKVYTKPILPMPTTREMVLVRGHMDDNVFRAESVEMWSRYEAKAKVAKELCLL